jgi:hypothetical protein
MGGPVSRLTSRALGWLVAGPLPAAGARSEALQSSIRSRWADQSVVRGSRAQSSGRPSGWWRPDIGASSPEHAQAGEAGVPGRGAPKWSTTLGRGHYDFSSRSPVQDIQAADLAVAQAVVAERQQLARDTQCSSPALLPRRRSEGNRWAKRHRRIRAHSTPGPIAGAATETSGSKPIAQKPACPACVPQKVSASANSPPPSFPGTWAS